MLLEHRGEVEFDFRHLLHTSLTDMARDSEPEAWRLLAILLKDTGTRTAAAFAGWAHPLSVDSMLLASIYTAWSGQPHPLMPDTSERKLSDTETQLADLALEAMNRR